MGRGDGRAGHAGLAASTCPLRRLRAAVAGTRTFAPSWPPGVSRATRRSPVRGPGRTPQPCARVTVQPSPDSVRPSIVTGPGTVSAIGRHEHLLGLDAPPLTRYAKARIDRSRARDRCHARGDEGRVAPAGEHEHGTVHETAPQFGDPGLSLRLALFLRRPQLRPAIPPCCGLDVRCGF